MSDLIQVTREDRLAIVTINRPPVNALNQEVLDALESAFAELKKDATVGCVILTGGGEKAFVAGADISEFPKLNKENGEILSLRGQEVFQQIADFPAPVIAAVNGFALGGGMELALACDIRVVAENALVGLPEVTLGIFPGYAGTQRLPRLIPAGKAKELIFTGAMINGAEAYRIGIADHLTSTGESVAKAKEIAAKILKNGPVAIRFAKEAVNKGLDQTLAEGQKTEASFFSDLCNTEDQKEGAQAFLEKRPPVFKGK